MAGHRRQDFWRAQRRKRRRQAKCRWSLALVSVTLCQHSRERRNRRTLEVDVNWPGSRFLTRAYNFRAVRSSWNYRGISLGFLREDNRSTRDSKGHGIRRA